MWFIPAVNVKLTVAGYAQITGSNLNTRNFAHQMNKLTRCHIVLSHL